MIRQREQPPLPPTNTGWLTATPHAKPALPTMSLNSSSTHCATSVAIIRERSAGYKTVELVSCLLLQTSLTQNGDHAAQGDQGFVDAGTFLQPCA